MKFMVCKSQEGEGCDYTIGCGMRYDLVEAPDIDAVIEKTIYPYGPDNYCAMEGEQALNEILIIPANTLVRVDMNIIRSELKEKRELAKRKAIEEKELAELKRLQEKYKNQTT